MDPFSVGAVAGAYDLVADDYVAAYGDDLARLPVDREVLDTALEAAPPGGVLELGCGPAPVADHYGGRAQRLVGLDLSVRMLSIAGRKNPGLARVRADLRALPFGDRSCTLAVAYYCLQHLPRADLPAALAETARVLADGGVLAVATHAGHGDVEIHEMLGHRVPTFAGAFHEADELVGLVEAAGFAVESVREREPLDHEYASRRLYLVARRGGG